MPTSFYWSVLRRYWYWPLLVALLGVAVGYAVTEIQPQMYSSSATLLIEPYSPLNSGNQYNDILSAERLANTYSELITSPALADEVIQTLKLDINNEKLLKLVTVRPVRETQLLKITVEYNDPSQATRLANQFAQSFIENNRKRLEKSYSTGQEALNNQLNQLRGEIADLNASLKVATTSNDPNIYRFQTQLQDKEATLANLSRTAQALQLEASNAQNSLTIAQPATLPTKPSWPVRWLNLLIGGVLGLVLGFVLAIGRGLLNERKPKPTEVLV